MFTEFFVNVDTHYLKDEEGGLQVLQLYVKQICMVWHAEVSLTGSAPDISVIYEVQLGTLREELWAQFFAAMERHLDVFVSACLCRKFSGSVTMM